MYCRDCIAQEFYIEEHAVLYGLLVKHGEALYGKAGLDAAALGTIRYGRERGHRMALRAQRDKQPLTMESYLLYGEWSDHLGWAVQRTGPLAPTFHTQVLRCPWYESFRKHDLLPQGALYCQYIDKSLVAGFDPRLELTIAATLPAGDAACDFGWNGVAFATPQEEASFWQRGEGLPSHVVKDFLYHSGHLLSAMGRTFVEELSPEAAEKITDAALCDFTRLFRESKTEALRIEARQSFDTI